MASDVAPCRPALRARLAVWGFVAGALVAGGVAWTLRGQHAALPGGLPRAGEGSLKPVPTHGVAAEANGLEMHFSGWTPLFRGIAYGHGESPGGKGGMMKIDALRIRLDEPGVSLHATHGNGDEPLETTGESTLDFLERNGLSVAVNAHFFSPCCEAVPEPKDLVGLAISGGELVSPPVAKDGTGARTLVVTFDHEAAVLDAPAPDDLSAIDIAVAGSDILLRDGAVVAPEDESEGFRFVHPRTAAGVSEDGRTLYLLTIDGRQIGWSNGATLRETAAWLRFIGADDGLNLDGGGSTTMVRAVAGKGVLLNRPVGLRIPGTLRWNGSNLGAVGAPLPE
ncbi:MAG: phosphodiester glycosidase family protein [Planctomycetota bacterium]